MDRRTRRYARLLSALLLALLASLIATQTMYANEIVVGGSCSLIDAIAAANTDTTTNNCTAGNGPDTIILEKDEPYTFAVSNNSTGGFGGNALPAIDSTITISGNNATIERDNVIARFRLFHVTSDGNLTLQDLTVANGQSSEFDDAGGLVNDGGQVTLENTFFTDNNGYFGGALANYGASAVMTLTAGTTLADNSADILGGGLYNSAGTVIVQYSGFYTNVASNQDGGGIYSDEGLLTVIDTQFISNSASLDGGGIYFEGNGIEIVNSDVLSNSAGTLGGGLYISATLAMTDTDISYNEAGEDGGGVYVLDDASVASSQIMHNEVPLTSGNDGGGIYANKTLFMTDTVVLGNRAGLGGGVITELALTVVNSRVESNEGNTYGGGLYSVETMFMTNTTVIDNKTNERDGAGVFVETGNAEVADSHFEQNIAAGDGGGLVGDQPLLVTNSTFLKNEAGEVGGGIEADHVTIIDSRLEQNEANTSLGNNEGGGLYASDALTMENTVVLSNTVGNGPGAGGFVDGPATVVGSTFEGNNRDTNAYGDGGGLYVYETLALTDTMFINNVGDNGGGLFVSGPATIAGSHFENNFSANDGGGLAALTDELFVIDSTFLNNGAGVDGGGINGRHITIIDSRLELNRASETTDPYHGGGLFARDALTMVNTVVLSNTAGPGAGGGVYVDGPTSVVGSHFQNNLVTGSASRGGAMWVGNGGLSIINSLLVSNTASDGGGLYVEGGGLSLLHVTMAANDATNSGSAISATTPVEIVSSILWNNSGFVMDSTAGIQVESSIVQGGVAGGQDVDPQFVRNANRVTGDLGDHHLQATSPAVDQGDFAVAVAANLTEDLDGNDRFVGTTFVSPIPDMGAFEYQNGAPVAVAGGPYTVNEGASVTLDGSGSSDDLGVAAYAWDCDDDGTADGATAQVNCTYLDDGAFTARLTVTDAAFLVDSATAQVTVNNVAPTVTGPANQTATEESSQSFSIGSFSDPGAEGNWAVTVAWGDGTSDTFNVNAAGNLPNRSHTYDDDGAYIVTITVNDGSENGVATFDVAVASNNVAPSIDSSPVETAEQGTLYSYNITASDGNGDTLTFSAPTKPAWLTLTPNGNGAATLAGTPGAGDVGANAVEIQVEDPDGAQDSQSFSIEVAAVEIETGSVVGSVVDSSSTGIDGAEVNLSNETGIAVTLVRTETTDGAGGYRFDDLPVGEYSLTVNAAGYVSPTPRTVTIREGETTEAGAVMLQQAEPTVYLPMVTANGAAIRAAGQE